MNSPMVLDENQVQNFIDYITRRNEIRLGFIRYIAYEWHTNPVQRKTLENFREVQDITDTAQAILFLLCSKGLGEIGQGKKKILLEQNISLKTYFEIIELIVQYGGGFQFDEDETAIIANKVIELKSEPDSAIRVFCVQRLSVYYHFCKSRYFVGMRDYFRDFLKTDILSITDLVILHDYYQAAFFFFWHFAETDADQVEIRDLVIDVTRQKMMDDFSADFSKIVKPVRRSVRGAQKKKVCFLSHKTVLYGPYANTRAFYSFLKGLYSGSADQFDFYWYALETTTDETVEELKNLGVKVRRFDKIVDVQEKMSHLLNSFDNDGIDVAISDYANFWVMLIYSIRVAPIQIYFSFGFVYFEFEGVDYLLLSKEDKLNDRIKTDIIDYESYNWLESRFLEGPNSQVKVQSNLETTFYPAVKQLKPQAEYIIGCYGRFALVREEYLSVIKTILNEKDNVIFFAFGPGDRSLAMNYFTRNGLRDRVIISGTSDPHVLGWALDIFCEQWPIWSGQSSLEVMAKGIPVVSYMDENISSFIDPYLPLRDSELVAVSHQEYVDMVIRLLEDQEYYKIKQNSVKEVSRRVTDLDGRAKDVGRQILLVLEQALQPESTR